MISKFVCIGLLGFLSISLLTGCATKSNKIPPIPVSELSASEYKTLSCDKLRDSYKQLEPHTPFHPESLNLRYIYFRQTARNVICVINSGTYIDLGYN